MTREQVKDFAVCKAYLDEVDTWQKRMRTCVEVAKEENTSETKSIIIDIHNKFAKKIAKAFSEVKDEMYCLIGNL